MPDTVISSFFRAICLRPVLKLCNYETRGALEVPGYFYFQSLPVARER